VYPPPWSTTRSTASCWPPPETRRRRRPCAAGDGSSRPTPRIHPPPGPDTRPDQFTSDAARGLGTAARRGAACPTVYAATGGPGPVRSTRPEAVATMAYDRDLRGDAVRLSERDGGDAGFLSDVRGRAECELGPAAATCFSPSAYHDPRIPPLTDTVLRAPTGGEPATNVFERRL